MPDGFSSEVCDRGGGSPPQRPLVSVDSDAHPGVTVRPVVSAGQVSATLHSDGKLGRVGVGVQAGQQGEADGRRALGDGGGVSKG